MSKAILSVIRADIQAAVGSHQLCVRQPSGCEAAIHALNELIEEDSTEGVLLVDASNAFNSLNRTATLLNVQSICLAFAAVLVNTYRSEPSLFIDGETIPSREGTTQGDPLAMAVYAIGILPLILHLQDEADQLWYADDSSAGGTIKNLRGWWDKLQKLGPNYGYFTNPQKSLLVVKEHCLAEAEATFEGTGFKSPLRGEGTWVQQLVATPSKRPL